MDRFKFRVWVKDNDKLAEDGFYADKRESDFCEFSLLPNGKLCLGCYCDDDTGGHVDYYNQDEYIIEQCTGLKDKNGKLIYEGDIICMHCRRYDEDKSKDYEYTIKFGEYKQDGSGDEYAPVSCVGFYADNGKNEFNSKTSILSLNNLSNDYPIEIIGNIHEAKE